MKYGRYMFEVFKIMGLATVALHKYSSKINVKSKVLFVHSFHGIIYNLILICLLTGCGSLAVYNRNEKIQNQSKMSRAIDIFGNSQIYIVSVIVILNNIINQKLAIKVGNKLYSVDLVLQRFESRYRQKYVTRHQTLVLSLYFTIWLFNISVGFFCNVTPVEALLTHVPNFIISCLIIQYVIVITFLFGMTRTINNEFRKCIGTKSFPVQKIQRIQLPLQYLSETERLLSLRDLSLNIQDASIDVSNFYSISVLLCITKLFFSIILNTYFIVKPSVFGRKNIISSVSDAWSFCWLSIDTFSLLILTKYVNAAVKEIKKTGDIVHRILQQSTNYDIKKQLEYFASHLLHKNVQFMAMDMFSLDHTLLQSIMGAMTTYLVILIQFQQENSCKKETNNTNT